MKLRTLLIVVLGLSCMAPAATALDRIAFEKPILGSQEADLAKLVDAILERTRATLATLHGNVLSTSTGVGAPYALKTVVTRDKTSFVLSAVLRRTRDDLEAAPIIWLSQPTDDLPLFIARSLFVRWSLLSGSVPGVGATPLFVDELSPEDIRATHHYLILCGSAGPSTMRLLNVAELATFLMHVATNAQRGSAVLAQPQF